MMSPLEKRLLKANKKVQILEKIHKLNIELFQIEKAEILSEYRAISEFLSTDDFLDDFNIDDIPEEDVEEKPKRKNSPTIAVRRVLFNNEPFESISVDI